jgi:Arm DNA-binding domain
LTKTVVDSLETTGGKYVRWCGELPGFGCRVRSKGAKSYVAQYRIGGRNGVVRKVMIGAVGKLTVEEASKAAKTILAGAELGQDEAERRARERAE